MQAAGIIVEYNPLHSGHLRLLEAGRALLGQDTAMVCVMSGNFVQRGDFALLRKHARARAAVESGADLVLELPLPWAVSSAEGFAAGGSQVLAATGQVDHLLLSLIHIFHQTMPAKAFMYALPYEYYEKDKVRRYGFHGTSHKYVAGRAAAMLGKPIEELKLISCHLGNGSSVTAIDGGKSVDTTMGFTPLAGLPMGTRSGDLDAGILEYIMGKYG